MLQLFKKQKSEFSFVKNSEMLIELEKRKNYEEQCAKYKVFKTPTILK